MPGGERDRLISGPQQTHNISRKDEAHMGYPF